MEAANWVALERRKAEAGGLVPFLVTEDGEAVGTVATMDFGPLLRLKNLVVHPRFRRFGIAKRTVRAILGRARLEGRRTVGCFVLSNGIGEDVYRGCGLVAVARQAEWM